MEPKSKPVRIGDETRARGSGSGAIATELVVQFSGEQRRVLPTETLSFGRAADLILDSNPHMHRTVGRFRYESTNWFVDNVGSRAVLTLRDPSQVAATVLPPGQSGRLISLDWTLGFRAGPTPYELHGHLTAGPNLLIERTPAIAAEHRFAAFELSELERMTLTALVYEHLSSVPFADVTSNKQMAHMLATTEKAIERRLDRLASRFAKAGVRGVKGTNQRADRRRRILAAHVLNELIITPRDLALIGGQL